MYLNMFRVVCFERSIMRLVEMNENRHHWRDVYN
jgi:hypothetical protein